LQSEQPHLSALIEVTSYYHLSLAASGVILQSAPVTLFKRSSAASDSCNLHLHGPTSNLIMCGTDIMANTLLSIQSDVIMPAYFHDRQSLNT